MLLFIGPWKPQVIFRCDSSNCLSEDSATSAAVKSAVPILDNVLKFPDPESADPDGLVAAGGDLSVPRLLLAYRTGVFPWTVAPVTWWSPDPRAIFELDAFHISRSLQRLLRQGVFRITTDQAFRQVIDGCARPGPDRRETWISEEFIEAYTRLHLQGHAHSVECWLGNELAGGIYGVAIGGLFAGESMFHNVSNASKIALFHLIEHLKKRGFSLFDIQMLTPITARLGGQTIPRRQYLRRLAVAVNQPCSF
jgi:leucyl/phenylalanyl-tRNA---protein transferase